MAFQPGQKRKFRCSYSYRCGAYDRHCFEVVAVDAPDVPGRCNYSCDCVHCDPDAGTPLEVAALQLSDEAQRKLADHLYESYKAAPGIDWAAVGFKPAT